MSGIPNRLQCYILRMSIFYYDIEYRKGSENGNADGLLRFNQ
jgi:hypothetical protein